MRVQFPFLLLASGLVLAAGLSGCSKEQTTSPLRLDLTACLVPSVPDAPGCGDGLRERFAPVLDGTISACLAVKSTSGSAAIPMAIHPGDGSMSPTGAGSAELPIPEAGGEISLRLFILDSADPSYCQALSPQTDCDLTRPRCLMATAAISRTVTPGTPVEVRFGEGAESCAFQCNDTCRPDDPTCVSVCHRSQDEAAEACDGRDNDCDGLVDEGCDQDGDGFCAAGVLVGGEAAPCPDTPRDCADDDSSLAPGRGELCNGVDDDCDGDVDEPGDIVPAGLCPEQEGVCAGARLRCREGVEVACEAGDYGPRFDGFREERCTDGLDNDCDGQPDGLDPDCACPTAGERRRCGLTVGVCVSGEQLCERVVGEGLRWGTCSAQTGSEERCDGLDNDCDNEVDEEAVGEETVCPATGVCEGRASVCEQGRWRCAFPEGYEAIERSCDTVDNDCDGEIDEALSPPRDAVSCPVAGVCSGGKASSVCHPAQGRWMCQFPSVGYEEEEVSCDSLDNDCDGEADEGCPCEAGSELPCGTSVGACEEGVQRCVQGFFGPCEQAIVPDVERCDGLDNDCDGRVDEGMEPPEAELGRCPDVGVCLGGVVACVEAEWQCAADRRQEDETYCDGLDNDCDGQVDESVDLAEAPEEELCPPRGVCEGRGPACRDGVWACDYPDRYENARGPDGAEQGERSCDGLDNDCDGLVDELPLDPPLERPCGLAGECRLAPVRCTEGVWQCELPVSYEAGDETQCDDLDNDCDGATDEAVGGDGVLGAACYEGPEGTLGVGRCVAGVHPCVAGRIDEGVCVGAVLPAPEDCNGQDDDCDGVVDEGEAGGLVTRPCYSGDPRLPGVGECQLGEERCVAEGAGWGACSGEVLAADELCDGLDNDCDGVNDESDGPQPLGEACWTGLEWQRWVGECSDGVHPCQDGVPNQEECVGEQGPGPELCDGLDNDCDEETDESEGPLPLGEACWPNAAAPEARGVGVCVDGVHPCVDGVPDADSCVGAVVPGDELCNGLDDDCDGEVDEASVAQDPARPQCLSEGLCVGSEAACDGQDGWRCDYPLDFVEEELSCDGVDDDCDGEVDESPRSGALAVSAQRAHLRLAGGVALGAGDLTVELWVRLADEQGGTLLDQGAPGGAPRVRLRVDADAGLMPVLELTDLGAEPVELRGDVRLEPNRWHHLAAQRQGRGLRLYVDGVPVAAAVVVADVDLDSAGADLVVGRSIHGDSPIAGTLDELHIAGEALYGSALAGALDGRAFVPAERLALQAASLHLWHMDEGEGLQTENSVEAGPALDIEPAEGAEEEPWLASGLPRRVPFFVDGDGDGIGALATAVMACSAPEDRVAVGGDCNDADGEVGAATAELSGDGLDNDCDGRIDEGIYGLSLDEAGAYMRVSAATGLRFSNGPMSWELWYRADSYSAGAMAPLISNRDSNTGWGYRLGVAGDGADQAGRLVFSLHRNGEPDQVSSDVLVPLGRWTHLAVSFSGAPGFLATLFIDGALVAQAELVSVPSGGTLVTIGKDRETDELANGWFDDVRVSDALRWQEAFDPPPCVGVDADTKALWTFEEDLEAAEVTNRAGASWNGFLLQGAGRVASGCDERDNQGGL